MQAAILAALVTLLIGAATGGWIGHRLAAGAAAAEQLTDARTQLDGARTALATAADELRTAATRTANVARRQAETLTRQQAEASRYEQIISRAARAECARDPAAYRELLDAIARANRSPESHPAGMPPDLRPGPHPGGPLGSQPSALGTPDRALGGALPADQHPLPARAHPTVAPALSEN